MALYPRVVPFYVTIQQDIQWALISVNKTSLGVFSDGIDWSSYRLGSRQSRRKRSSSKPLAVQIEPAAKGKYRWPYSRANS